MRKAYYCPHCGSKSLLWDASARWNESTQQMGLNTAYNACTCDECGEEVTPICDELGEVSSAGDAAWMTAMSEISANDPTAPAMALVREADAAIAAGNFTLAESLHDGLQASTLHGAPFAAVIVSEAIKHARRTEGEATQRTAA